MEAGEEIYKVIAGEADNATKQKVFSNIDVDKQSKEEFNRAKNAAALLASTKELPTEKAEAMYDDFSRKRDNNYNFIRLKIIQLAKYAAFFLLAVGVSALFFGKQSTKNIQSNILVTETKVIAENGQRSKIILPDSSVVWLNSGTQLAYNNQFGLTNRDIKLAGQAFFQVTRNEKLAMIIRCNNLKIKVLGTTFDVNGYADNNQISVALQKGRVELLSAKSDTFNYKIIPGEVAKYDLNTEKVTIAKTNINRVTAWTDGILYFNDSPMAQVIRQLERKYNIEIVVNNPKIFNSVFTATIKSETLEEIFRSIEYSCVVKYQIIRGMERDVKTKVIINQKNI